MHPRDSERTPLAQRLGLDNGCRLSKGIDVTERFSTPVEPSPWIPENGSLGRLGRRIDTNRSVFGSGPAAVEGYRRTRIARYLAVLLAFVAVLAVFEWVIASAVTLGLLPRDYGPSGSAWLRAWTLGAICLALASVRHYAQSHSDRSRVATALETCVTVAACVAVAQLQRVAPNLPVASPTVLMLPVTLVLVLRASYVPSRATTTFFIGAVVSLAVAATTSSASHADQAWLMLVWGGAFTAATTVTSHLLYAWSRRFLRGERFGNDRSDEKLGARLDSLGPA